MYNIVRNCPVAMPCHPRQSCVRVPASRPHWQQVFPVLSVLGVVASHWALNLMPLMPDDVELTACLDIFLCKVPVQV